MIKNPLYRPMLNAETISYDPVDISGHNARQRVTLTGKGGNVIVYVFYLSRQAEGSCAGCWLTDAVLIESMAPQEQLGSPPKEA